MVMPSGSSPRPAMKSSAIVERHLRHERPDDLRRDLARIDQELLPARVRREDLDQAGGARRCRRRCRGVHPADLQQLLGRIEEAVLRAMRRARPM
jgi:hypothetical protein